MRKEAIASNLSKTTGAALSYVLNNLQDGPISRALLFRVGLERRFTVEELKAAARHLGVTEHELDGETYWMRPANLFAIWWGKRPAHWYERRRESSGSAA